MHARKLSDHRIASKYTKNEEILTSSSSSSCKWSLRWQKVFVFRLTISSLVAGKFIYLSYSRDFRNETNVNENGKRRSQRRTWTEKKKWNKNCELKQITSPFSLVRFHIAIFFFSSLNSMSETIFPSSVASSCCRCRTLWIRLAIVYIVHST